MSKKRLIPHVLRFVVIFVLVLVGFHAWHDGSLEEIFVLELPGSSYPTDWSRASYPAWVLRPEYFLAGADDVGFRILRYRSREDLKAIYPESAYLHELPGMNVILSAEQGRQAIHRLAAMDLKFLFSIISALIAIAYIYFFFSRPLWRQKKRNQRVVDPA
jgi:hypothetical protein